MVFCGWLVQLLDDVGDSREEDEDDEDEDQLT